MEGGTSFTLSEGERNQVFLSRYSSENYQNYGFSILTSLSQCYQGKQGNVKYWCLTLDLSLAADDVIEGALAGHHGEQAGGGHEQEEHRAHDGAGQFCNYQWLKEIQKTN